MRSKNTTSPKIIRIASKSLLIPPVAAPPSSAIKTQEAETTPIIRDTAASASARAFRFSIVFDIMARRLTVRISEPAPLVLNLKSMRNRGFHCIRLLARRFSLFMVTRNDDDNEAL